MTIGLPPITWDLKHNWRHVGLLLGTPLPNRSGITGVILCYVGLSHPIVDVIYHLTHNNRRDRGQEEAHTKKKNG